jgi:ankyrin repeat protein
MGSEPRMQKALRQLSALDAKARLDLEFDPSALLACSLLKTSPVVASSFASQGTSAIGTRVRCPALHESLRCENPQVIREVLRIVLTEKQQDPDEGLDSRDTLGRTPLFLAAALGNEELCDSLIKAGANVDAADYDGHTVLEVAARNGLLRTVSTLLELGANVNQPIIRDGMTPLQAAAALVHAEVVECLLRHGAKEAVSTEKTATLLALENGHYNIAETIGPEGSTYDSRSLTPIEDFLLYDDPSSEDWIDLAKGMNERGLLQDV